MNKSEASFFILIVVLMLTPDSAEADGEKEIYELLPDVTIGRVFFSPEQRALLDKKRKGIFVAVTSRSNGRTGRKKTDGDAAGYISTSNGPVRVYKNGDFVETNNSKSVVFPGTVKVVRGADTKDDESRNEDD